MADDFVPSPPDFNLYWSDNEGNIDFRNRETTVGLWKKEKDGKEYWVGKTKATNRRFILFPNTKKTDEPDW